MPIALVSSSVRRRACAALAAAALLVALPPPAPAQAASAATFDYTGGTQTWKVPRGVTSVTAEVQGAQGGGTYGGFGATVRSTLAVRPGQELQVLVGGHGALGVGGFNGGGNTGVFSGGPGQSWGGGGASDLRTASDPSTRVVVAGGGGGASGSTDPIHGMGGSAGGTRGESGVDGTGVHLGGGGGTDVQPGSSGGAYAGPGVKEVGGSGGYTAGAGGGGWFGGGGGGGDSSGGSPGGGGAGSSYAGPGATRTTFVQGGNIGDGHVSISWKGSVPIRGDKGGKYAYTGAPHLYRAGADAFMSVHAVGGRGGSGTRSGGLAAEISGIVPVEPGQVVAVMVGGAGGRADGCGALTCEGPVAGTSLGGWNGGGTNTFEGAGAGRGSGGGGATDVRVGSWKLDSRVVVAAGGGGSAVNPPGTGSEAGLGGSATGAVGESGHHGDGRHPGGTGGSQRAGGKTTGDYAGGGAAGRGGAGGFLAGSGGGGWFGGAGGGGDSTGGSPGGGGAGSSHVVTSTLRVETGLSGKTVDGYAEISPSSGVKRPSGPVQATRMVGMGDSYSSGEGAEDGYFTKGTVFSNKDGAGTTGCHRASTSWEQLVGKQAKAIKLVKKTSFVACSGATVRNVFESNLTYRSYGEVEDPQLDAVTPSTGLVVMSMGGNDFHFADVAKACIQTPTNHAFGCSEPGHDGYALVADGLAAVADGAETIYGPVGVSEAYRRTAERMDHGTVLALGYPAPFATSPNLYQPDPTSPSRLSCQVGPLELRVDRDDASWLNDQVGKLNAELQRQVDLADAQLQRSGSRVTVTFVSPSPTFTNHRLCSGDAWLNGVLLGQGLAPLQQSVHPNRAGQAGYYQAVCGFVPVPAKASAKLRKKAICTAKQPVLPEPPLRSGSAGSPATTDGSR